MISKLHKKIPLSKFKSMIGGNPNMQRVIDILESEQNILADLCTSWISIMDTQVKKKTNRKNIAFIQKYMGELRNLLSDPTDLDALYEPAQLYYLLTRKYAYPNTWNDTYIEKVRDNFITTQKRYPWYPNTPSTELLPSAIYQKDINNYMKEYSIKQLNGKQYREEWTKGIYKVKTGKYQRALLSYATNEIDYIYTNILKQILENETNKRLEYIKNSTMPLKDIPLSEYGRQRNIEETIQFPTYILLLGGKLEYQISRIEWKKKESMKQLGRDRIDE